MRDWSQYIARQNTDELQRLYRFHNEDRGTMTAEEETRRCFLVQAIGEELARRGALVDA